ncbi:TetR/AcrR family transcriptional regulator [Amycolatopsis keratiniphila]|uniref:TetR/AcrR family transcriptional regulator n=1 Tax=Amycolatopsis keratiniphila TaxID=129921 RepID=UPI00087CD35A|nr:TetR/AcrR family transcriptional regulator [Amycolatopsis keratiniphila]OLZ60720.1 TetR family transcriptional regulator [Amycolatopsis keratiniphila subsp. nogabecina]SDU66243.1 DNA-binding transcriptional regulator, AcrR family [Amycolatopsis keratiniphila]
MTDKSDRIARRSVDKFALRRAELADSALETLSELGYARTSLREIAQKSNFSHGVLHYYFTDKVELLTYAIRRNEEVWVTRCQEDVASARSASDLKHGFGAAMAGTLRADAIMHRLWYDLRNQSLYEDAFRSDVLVIDERREATIWCVVERYANLAGGSPLVTRPVAYATFDGLFYQALLRHLAGEENAGSALEESVNLMLEHLVAR